MKKQMDNVGNEREKRRHDQSAKTYNRYPKQPATQQYAIDDKSNQLRARQASRVPNALTAGVVTLAHGSSPMLCCWPPRCPFFHYRPRTQFENNRLVNKQETCNEPYDILHCTASPQQHIWVLNATTRGLPGSLPSQSSNPGQQPLRAFKTLHKWQAEIEIWNENMDIKRWDVKKNQLRSIEPVYRRW